MDIPTTSNKLEIAMIKNDNFALRLYFSISTPKFMGQPEYLGPQKNQ
jgi:hypothetical protein